MYVITNREVTRRKQRDLKQFGDNPNKLGNNELRVARVTKKNNKWDAFILPNTVTSKMAEKLIKDNKLSLDPKGDHYASLRVACEVVNKARKEKRHILFFVHGYNNNFEDTIERAWDFEQRYGVVCLVFSWPANGGGVKGIASYKADKRDARASTGALERTLMIMYQYLELVSSLVRIFVSGCTSGLRRSGRRMVWREIESTLHFWRSIAPIPSTRSFTAWGITC